MACSYLNCWVITETLGTQAPECTAYSLPDLAPTYDTLFPVTAEQ